MTRYRLEGLQPLVTIPPPETIATNSSGENRCFQFDFTYDLTTSIICVMYLMFGVIYSMFGYRCFKAVMFLTGFFFGSVVVYLICLEEELLPTYGNAGVALGAGILFGLITMLVQYVGLFMTGFHSGLFMGVIAIVVMQEWYSPGTIWIVVGLLLGSGLLMAMLTLYWQKGLTIFGTCLYGGAVMTASIDYFIEKFSTLYWIWDKIKLTKDTSEPCWYGWIILCTWPCVFLLGFVIQWTITGTGQHHYELRPSKSRQVNLQRIRTREERAEARQKKYRYLYQIRTAHGDIISQDYIQSLQRKVQPNTQIGDNSTLQSDATHLTILPPDQAQLTLLSEEQEIHNDSDMEVLHRNKQENKRNSKCLFLDLSQVNNT